VNNELRKEYFKQVDKIEPFMHAIVSEEQEERELTSALLQA
jgi:hypothetical protein